MASAFNISLGGKGINGHPWRGLLAFVVYFGSLLGGNRFGVVFKMTGVVTKGFHDVVGELPVTLPGVAQQIEVGLAGLESP